LPLLGEDEDGLATGGAADAFPVFGCVVEPAFTDAVWAAAAAALYTARLPHSAVESAFCFASEATKETGAFFWIYPSPMLERRPCGENDFFGSPLCRCADFSILRVSNKGVAAAWWDVR